MKIARVRFSMYHKSTIICELIRMFIFYMSGHLAQHLMQLYEIAIVRATIVLLHDYQVAIIACAIYHRIGVLCSAFNYKIMKFL